MSANSEPTLPNADDKSSSELVSTPSERPAPLLIIFMIVPLLGILVALLMVASEGQGAANPASTTPGTLPGQAQMIVNREAPGFALEDLGGTVVDLEEYRGRTLFLNFWQTTCAPCVRELPAFATFSNEQGTEGAQVLAVNFDETRLDVQSFLGTLDAEGLRVALDGDSTVRRSYGVQMIPTTFIIGPEGRVHYMHLGEISLEQMEEYLRMVAENSAS